MFVDERSVVLSWWDETSADPILDVLLKGVVVPDHLDASSGGGERKAVPASRAGFGLLETRLGG
eukprot:m.131552 g.131552  ORF g.131552 m.131552 type:complete len:64 (+) comp13759_c0_seq2:491-682(+)